VQRYVPEFETRWSRYTRPVNGSWPCDETYLTSNDRWTLVGRWIKSEKTVEFYLSKRRDVNAAKNFVCKAMKSVGPPRLIMLDAYAAYIIPCEN